MVKIILNGKEVEADPKKPLIKACHKCEADVPMYCYHPGLTPVGSCRMCQVEVQVGKMPARVVVACRTPVSEGMVVNTEAPGAHAARKQCLEFLLKNHPLDCPICDKAGECDLQDYAFNEGQDEGRSVEPRRKLEKRKSLGDVIVLDQERCVLCSRCVRFFEDITHEPQLAVSGMGARSAISTFMDRALEGNYQGNLADICPVGALTLKKFRFQARVWNLTKHFSTCGECSRGCSVSVETLRGQAVKRMRPRYNAKVNEWWMCDTGRFSFERFNSEGRIEGAFLRGERGFEPVRPFAALGQVRDIFSVRPQPVLVVSPWLTIEEGALVVELAKQLDTTARFVSPPASGLKDELLNTGDPCPNRRGLEELGIKGAEASELLAEMKDAQSALLLGERVAELLGMAGLGETPSTCRTVLVDTHAIDAPTINVAMGAPNSAERTGTWVNLDGVHGRITTAKPAPRGVPALTKTLEMMLTVLATSPATSTDASEVQA